MVQLTYKDNDKPIKIDFLSFLSSFIISLLLAIEGSVSLADLWVKNGDLLWWWDSGGFFLTIITFQLDEFVIMEFLSLHCDVLSEILITVHSGGEEFDIGWST